MKRLWLAGLLGLLSLGCQREEETGSGSSSKEKASEAAQGTRTSKATDRSGSKKSIPTAEPVPGRPGFVKSPHNGAIVDVTDVPAGTIVADPGYPADAEKQFRVPQMAEVPEEELLKGIKVDSLPILDMEAKADAPTATVAPGKPGFIISPWDQRELDASGFDPGALITDPSSTLQEPRFLKIPADHVRAEEPPAESK